MKKKILTPMFASAMALSMSTIANADNTEVANKVENTKEDNKAIQIDEYKEEKFKTASIKDGVAVKIRQDGDVKKVAYTGDSFKVVGVQGEWVKVALDEENEGWVPTRYVDITNSKGYVSADKVNFRKESNKDSEIIKELEIGKDLEVLEVSGEWVKVKHEEQEGYVSAAYLSEEAPVIEEEVVEEVVEQETEVLSSVDNSQEEVSSQENTQTRTENTSKTTQNNRVQNTQTSNVEKPKQEQSNVSTSVVEETQVQESDSTKVQAVLNLAYSKQGCPYAWGSEGPNSFDCSGFTYYVFKNAAGISLPRTSSAQSGYGETVSKSNLKPGDLVFFNTSGKGVSHVGIYVGGGNMIHSPSSGKTVSITSINSSYYSARFVTAKRVL